MAKHRIRIRNGKAEFVYSDELVPLAGRLGKVTVTRASHVEPYALGGWYADMTPSGGPFLYANGWGDDLASGEARGFTTRAEALDAERQWLRDHKGL